MRSIRATVVAAPEARRLPPAVPGDSGWEERALRAFDDDEPFTAALDAAPGRSAVALVGVLAVAVAGALLLVFGRASSPAGATPAVAAPAAAATRQHVAPDGGPAVAGAPLP